VHAVSSSLLYLLVLALLTVVEVSSESEAGKQFAVIQRPRPVVQVEAKLAAHV